MFSIFMVDVNRKLGAFNSEMSKTREKAASLFAEGLSTV